MYTPQRSNTTTHVATLLNKKIIQNLMDVYCDYNV